jgi:hypothetical protein
MTSLINASNSAGVIITSDTSGNLAIQSGGNTVATITATGANAGIQVASWASPAFSAYGNGGQSLTNSTYTKLVFQNKEFDTSSAFDATTNYRFTPTVAGYYQVSGAMTISGASSVAAIGIYKNNSNFKVSQGALNSAYICIEISSLVYLNGSSDYIELFGYQSSGITTTTYVGGATYNYFQAALVRSA